jgi:hypothetical protein
MALGKCRMRTAVVLVPQTCEVGLTLQAPQSLAGEPDVEAAAAKPQEDGAGGHPFLYLGAEFRQMSVQVDAPVKEAFGGK